MTVKTTTALVVAIMACVGAAPAAADRQDRIDEMFQRGPGPKFCPGNEGRTWNAKRDILGKRLSAARRIAARHGCYVRVVIRDGKHLVVTSDLNYHRLNVSIKGKQKRVVRIVDVA